MKKQKSKIGKFSSRHTSVTECWEFYWVVYGIWELKIINVYMHTRVRNAPAGQIILRERKTQDQEKEEDFEKENESNETQHAHTRRNVYLHFAVDCQQEKKSYVGVTNSLPRRLRQHNR